MSSEIYRSCTKQCILQYTKFVQLILFIGFVGTLACCGTVPVETAIFFPSDSGTLNPEELSDRGIEEISFKTEDNETLYSLYLANQNSDLITLYFQGNGGNIHSRVETLEALRDLGSSVLGVSYRGYLNSTGASSEEGLYADARAALTYSNAVLDYPLAKTIVVGRSLGSAVAIDLAQNRNLHKIILVSPFSNAKDQFESFSSFKRSFIADNNNFIGTAFRNDNKASRILSPVLVIHGKKDNLIPFSLGEKLYQLLPHPKEFFPLDGADHNNFGYRKGGALNKIYWSKIEEFLKTDQ